MGCRLLGLFFDQVILVPVCIVFNRNPSKCIATVAQMDNCVSMTFHASFIESDMVNSIVFDALQ